MGEAGRLLNALKAAELGAEAEVPVGGASADASTTVGGSALEREWGCAMGESGWESEEGGSFIKKYNGRILAKFFLRSVKRCLSTLSFDHTRTILKSWTSEIEDSKFQSMFFSRQQVHGAINKHIKD